MYICNVLIINVMKKIYLIFCFMFFLISCNNKIPRTEIKEEYGKLITISGDTIPIIIYKSNKDNIIRYK